MLNLKSFEKGSKEIFVGTFLYIY